MRGRKSRPLAISRDDLSILLQICRRPPFPTYQVQRARIVLGVAAGEPTLSWPRRTMAI